MIVKFKKLDAEAVIPSYAREGDAGLDLTTINNGTLSADFIEYSTGLSVEIPTGYVGLIFPRSSLSKYDLSLTNSVGVIDSGYRGEIKFRFRITSDEFKYPRLYKTGDRIGQLLIIPYPVITLVETDELTQTSRGKKGFGSSG